MLDIGSSELLLIVVVAIVVIGPKDLPRALYKMGQVLGKARAMSRHFRSGVDAMIREVELEEMEKKWAAENRRIMAQHPSPEPLPEGVATDNGNSAPEPDGSEDEPVKPMDDSGPAPDAPLAGKGA